MACKIGIISLGCAKNLVNSEQMMYLLTDAGYNVSGDLAGADVVVVNTCAFIESAKAEAIETILEMGKMKSEGNIKRLVVAGCLPERYRGDVLEQMPEIDAIVGAGSFDGIVDAVDSILNDGEKIELFGDINARVSETKRIITTSAAWAYLKIAEGCDNRCSYCVIPDIRGHFRSRPLNNVINEAKELASGGVKELIIVAQDVSRYGLDLYGKRRLPELLKELCKINALKWIRLHYLYPDEINEELVDVIAKNDKILKYLDIPIQHISDKILRKMNRRGSGAEITSLFESLREDIPGVVIRTSIIAGLPGETEKEFEELCSFLRKMKIERAGVFVYSPEEGTPAAKMKRPDTDIAERRAATLADIQALVMDEYNKKRVGSVTTVLIEGISEDKYYGRSYAESPEVDGYITIEGKDMKPGEFVDVLITDAQDGELQAIVVKKQ